MSIIWHILLLSLAIFIIAKVLPSIQIKSFWTAIVVAIVYTLIDLALGWFLRFISFPFIFITLGLVIFVINAIMLWITDKLIEDFKIDGLGATLFAAFLITVTNSILNWIF